MSARALLSFACAAFTVMALGAPVAQASTLAFGSGVYTYTGTTADNTVTIEGDARGAFIFTDSATITVLASADSRCGPSALTVTCDAASITTIVANTGVGNDDLSTSRDSTLSVPLEADGGTGNDSITSWDADDTLAGGDGSDTLSGGAGDDLMVGEIGNDNLTGADGGDLLFGGEGNDVISGGDGEDTINGDEDDDTVIAGPENDAVRGGDGTGDRIRYDEGNRGTAVVVDLSTPAGSDGGSGETSEDAVEFERVTGTRFADQITGSNQANVLDGGLADDRLLGGAGADQLHGMSGADVLDGGPGADVLDGGVDVDVGDYAARTENLTVTVGDGTANDGAPSEQDQVLATETLRGGTGNDSFTMVEPTAAAFHGNGGDDVLTGGALDDVLVGGAGGDTIDGRGGVDRTAYDEAGRTSGVVVSVGAGSRDDGSGFDAPGDTVLAIESVVGTAFADTLLGDGLANELLGGGGDDLLQGGAGADVLRGGDGIDTVSYSDRTAGQPVTLALGTTGNGAPLEGDDAGADIENAIGGGDADVITGDDGPNTLEGGAGNDLITGLGGVDVFSAGEGDDLVRAVDGNAESVDCGGGGGDVVDPDPADQLAGCEGRVVAPPLRKDSDGDAFFDDQDCAPFDARIRPGALEVPGNTVDENCDRLTPDFPVLSTLITVFVDVHRQRGARITSLIIRGIPAGGRLVITCKPPRGKRCPFTRAIRRTFPNGRSRIDFVASFKRKRLPAGTVVEIRVTKADAIGKVRIERIRRGDSVSRALCVRPGASRAIRCPT